MTVSLSMLVEVVRPLYDWRDPAHRFDHIERILEFCLEAGPALGAEMEFLLSAALIHGVRGDERPRKILAERYEKVLNLARNALRNPQTLEEKILWDANILDSLGAIGLARAFTRGGHEEQTVEKTVGIIKVNMKRSLLTQERAQMAKECGEFMRLFLDSARKQILNIEWNPLRFGVLAYPENGLNTFPSATWLRWF